VARALRRRVITLALETLGHGDNRLYDGLDGRSGAGLGDTPVGDGQGMTAMENGALEDIDVTVTFLEMHVPPAYSPPVPYNTPDRAFEDQGHSAAFLSLLDGIVSGGKWHWVNVLRLSDEELFGRSASRRPRHQGALSSTARRPGFFDLKPASSR